MTMWHLGRFKFLNLYCKSDNIPLPRIAIGEWGFDHLNDIEMWLNTLTKTAPYTSIRGWKSLNDQWQEWFRGLGWSSERAYVEQLDYARKAIYENTNVVGMAVYCSYSFDPQWEQFEVSKADEFQKWRTALAALPQPPVPVQPPTPPPVVVPVPPVEPVEPVKMISIPLDTLISIRSSLKGTIDIKTRGIVQDTALLHDLEDDMAVIDEVIRTHLST